MKKEYKKGDTVKFSSPYNADVWGEGTVEKQVNNDTLLVTLTNSSEPEADRPDFGRTILVYVNELFSETDD